MSEKKEKKLNIYQRLHAAMKEVEYVQKEDKKVNNQYTFVSHDAVTSKTREALMKQGVIYYPQNLQFQQNGNRTEVKLDIHFVNIDDPKDTITVPSFGYGVDQQDKGPGKAISYAVKYALLKTLALETGDDPERDNVDHKPENGKPGKIMPVEKTGNPAVDRAVQDAVTAAKNCVDREGLEAVFKYQNKLLRDSGATEQQMGYFTDACTNHSEYLENRTMEATE